jgi:hypothetical protein
MFFWAWERPDDLASIDIRHAGAAILDRTIRFTSERADVRYRQHVVRVPDRAVQIAVVRIEGKTAHVSDEVRRQIVREVIGAARRPSVRALQIDFDATTSQRSLYRRVLTDIRAALPPDMPLGITALASWCADPAWLDALPIDEAVPMVFQMGPDAGTVRRQLARGDAFASRRCRGTLGVATDEPLTFQPMHRVYIFSPRPWTPAAVASAVRSVRR